MKKKVIAFGIMILIPFFFFIIILIPVMSAMGFFSFGNLNNGEVKDNSEYATEYKVALNKYLNIGYVPIYRIAYFKDTVALSIEEIYALNLDQETGNTINIDEVCVKEEFINSLSCTEDLLIEERENLEQNKLHFNLPILNSTITSFYKEDRVIFGKANRHGGWDFGERANTPVMSIGTGVVTRVSFTQSENIGIEGGGRGNFIEIEYVFNEETFTAIYMHLYPNSALVSEGDTVTNFQEIATVGTTGNSTGNHLHIELRNANREGVDLFELTNFQSNKEEIY